MTQFVYKSSLETYPYMKRKKHKWVKACDYLAWRLQTVRLVSYLSQHNANGTMVLEPIPFDPNAATQVNRIVTAQL